MGVIIMRTESTREPEPLEIRKLGIIDDEPVVYLYLHSDVKQVTEPGIDGEPHTKCTYDMIQITNPIPVELLPEIDLTLIAYHGYNQTKYKQKTWKHMKEIKTSLKEVMKHSVKNVDRLDRLSDITDADLKKIQKHTKTETKQL